MSVTKVSPPPVAAGTPATAAGPWWVVAIVLVGSILDLLDALVTTIAGPTIMRDLGGTQGFIQWLAAGYTVAMAAGLLIGGRLGDRYGRKRMFMIGLAGFTLASLVSAIAATPETLIAARVLQGLLGALMVPQGLGLMKQVFPPDKLGVAFGLTGPVMALSGVAGPVVAGWLVDADYFGWGWRMIFAINVPIGVVTLIAAAFVLPRSRRQPELTADVGGAVLAAAGMGGLIFALVQGRELGWPWWIFVVLVGSAAALAWFALHQVRRGAKGRSTLVVPSLFGKRAFVSGLAVGLLFFGVMMGGSLVFSLFFQLGLGQSPLVSGLATIAQAAGMVVGFGLSQKLGMTRRTMFVGFATVAVGLLGAIATVVLPEGAVNVWSLSPALAVVGIGSGLAIAPYFDIVLAGVDDAEIGSASGTLTAAQQTGNALGVSVLGTVFFAVLDAHQSDGGSAFATATWVATGASLVAVAGAALCALLLPRQARHGGHGGPHGG
ncbi:MFS transporter [Actinokineospora sp. G85]|uniref:MFS transporter n=1 Tax=Actinokineospora sp. G85 TaxID=3406626 RepID=UPI003C79515D